MRVGIIPELSGWEALRSDVRTAGEAGLDLVWLPTGHPEARHDAPLAATALSSHAAGLNVVVEVAAGTHPIGLAEELAVADQALGGRVTGVLCGEDAALVGETLTVLRAALGGRPFRHEGERWTLPADPGSFVSLTPPPAQLRLPLWLRGAGLEQLAAETGTVLVDDPAAPGAPGGPERPALRACPLTADGVVDVAACVTLLLAERDERGVDICALSLDAGLDVAQRAAAVRRLADRVRPQVQLPTLPPELVASWDEPPAGGR